MFSNFLLVRQGVSKCPGKRKACTFTVSESRVVFRVFVLKARIIPEVEVVVLTTDRSSESQVINDVPLCIHVTEGICVEVSVVQLTITRSHWVSWVVETSRSSTCIATKFVINRNDGRHTEGLKDVVFVSRYTSSTSTPCLTQYLTVSSLEVLAYTDALGYVKLRVGTQRISFEVVTNQDTTLLLDTQANKES